VEVWQTSNLQRLRLSDGEKEEDKKKKKPQGKNIMVCPIPQGDHYTTGPCINLEPKTTTANDNIEASEF